MPQVRYEQSNFTQGELDPRIYGRTDTEMYYKGAKQISNALVIPQGGVRVRWGLRFVDSSATNNPLQVDGSILNAGTTEYLIEFGPLRIYIYCGNTISVTGGIASPYPGNEIPNIRFTQVNGRLIVVHPRFIPYQLIASASVNFNVTPANTNFLLAVVTGGPDNSIYEVRFTGGILPITGGSPVLVGVSYYARFVAVGLDARIFVFLSQRDAEIGASPLQWTVSANVAQMVVYNQFTFTPVQFSVFPTYDFNGGYDLITFTPSALFGTTAALVTLTASAAIFTAEHVGGIFEGNGGVLRITNFDSATSVRGWTIHNFSTLDPVQGANASLEVPAWSATRGYPRCTTFFQNRLAFGGSPSIPNGVWLSVVGSVFNFDDSEKFADNAISWYAASGDSSRVLAFTSARSLVVHTDTANYSTPTFSEVGITPENFVLLEQNKDGSFDVQPVFVDNQIIYIDKSGTNIKNMIWDVGQSAYVLNNISVKAAHLIKGPRDIAVFSNPQVINGALVLFVNDDGTLTVFQTLSQEGIGAYSSSFTDQTTNTGNVIPNHILHVVSSGERLWMWVARFLADNVTPVITIEEMDFSIFSDFATSFVSTGVPALYTSNVLANKQVRVNVFDVTQNVRTQYILNANGAGQITISEPNLAQVTFGLDYTSTLKPLPIATIPGTNANLYSPTHIRALYVNYFQTVGATVQGNFLETRTLPLVLPASNAPSDGIALYTLMEGWDQSVYDISITQTLASPMTIRALAYIVDI